MQLTTSAQSTSQLCQDIKELPGQTINIGKVDQDSLLPARVNTFDCNNLTFNVKATYKDIHLEPKSDILVSKFSDGTVAKSGAKMQVELTS
jgi:hypothetical protein